MSFKIDIMSIVNKAVNQVNAELPGRAVEAANELRNAALEVLRGKRSGRVYRLGRGGSYRASAPGEPPAARTGTLRRSWRAVTSGPANQNPAIESGIPYAWLDQGGSKIAPRPYSKETVEKARPQVEAIYSKPYNISP